MVSGNDDSSPSSSSSPPPQCTAEFEKTYCAAYSIDTPTAGLAGEVEQVQTELAPMKCMMAAMQPLYCGALCSEACRDSKAIKLMSANDDAAGAKDGSAQAVVGRFLAEGWWLV
jgi:hypothetical protein